MTWGSRRRRGYGGDEGSALILVLLLIVVAGLIVVPMMAYAVSVLRANEVVGERTARAEAVKAGFRYAMADPGLLYETCDADGASVPSPQLSIQTVTTCYLVDTARAVADDQLPYGVATTFAGVAAPTGSGGVQTPYPNSGIDVNAWLNDASQLPTDGKVWLPNLPVHALNLRSGTGFAMASGFPLNGYSTCTVYFPGTYRSELVINGPTYFASGIYYFERQVTLAGGADAVAGLGTYEGCSDDQFAAFYAINAPATHNITGLGATFVFGDEGQLVVDDTAGPVSFRMNQRYVSATDTGGAASAKVSIITVNGDLDPLVAQTNPTAAGIPLVLPDEDNPRLIVPLSTVEGRPAPVDSYLPSTLVPRRHPPSAPLNVTATPYNGAVVVSWQAPESDGGLPVSEYRVSSTVGAFSCTTGGQTSCAITGLANGTNYSFQVIASNEDDDAKLDSDPSALSAPVRPLSGLATLTVPAAPPNLLIQQSPTLPVVDESRYRDALVISWDPETPTSGVAPVSKYDVIVTDLDPASTAQPFTCTTFTATTCTLTGLPPADPLRTPTPYLAQYRVEVTATSAVGQSTVSTLPTVTLAPSNTGEAYAAPPVAPHPPYAPPPVLDVLLRSGNAVTFIVPGYVSAPQGVVRVGVAPGGDPSNKQVELQGGALSTWLDVAATRPDSFGVSIENPISQHKIRIETRTVETSNTTSTAVVQINKSGGWAVNSWVVQ